MVRVAVTAVAFLAALIGLAAHGSLHSPAAQSPTVAEVGNDACAPCHKSIYETYSRTAMARTSGRAFPHVIEGSFDHAPSGVSYRIRRAGGAALLSFDRAGPFELHGHRELKYYVGSNTRGRTFLFDTEGFLYQSPINYYAAKHVWDMSPGYANIREMELNHPVDRTCLFCHSSRVQASTAGTVNRFPGDPFLQAGVGCERCHGPGSDHVKGLGRMINPARLAPERRDSICMQCHLEGATRIAVAGRTEDAFTPGDKLSDFVAVFVRRDGAVRGLGSISQVEALAESACKRSAGDRMSCITCHNPHVQLTADEKPAYYRARCLGCHQTKAATHHSEQQDCTACHMPRLDSADISHTMVTDHRIVRHESGGRPASTSSALIEFGNPAPRAREAGLAYGEIALTGEAFAVRESLRLLEEALKTYPDDADVLMRLGYLYQLRGDSGRAATSYERALKNDPDRAVVAANLGVFDARRGMVTEALKLWRDAFDKNPQLTDLAVNLGGSLCASGDLAGARQVLERALRHNPDSGAARRLLSGVTERTCRQQ
jgi:Flp pilus assembly protein TadD